jgi:hypothetical protein
MCPRSVREEYPGRMSLYRKQRNKANPVMTNRKVKPPITLAMTGITMLLCLVDCKRGNDGVGVITTIVVVVRGVAVNVVELVRFSRRLYTGGFPDLNMIIKYISRLDDG